MTELKSTDAAALQIQIKAYEDELTMLNNTIDVFSQRRLDVQAQLCSMLGALDNLRLGGAPKEFAPSTTLKELGDSKEQGESNDTTERDAKTVLEKENSVLLEKVKALEAEAAAKTAAAEQLGCENAQLIEKVKSLEDGAKVYSVTMTRRFGSKSLQSWHTTAAGAEAWKKKVLAAATVITAKSEEPLITFSEVRTQRVCADGVDPVWN